MVFTIQYQCLMICFVKIFTKTSFSFTFLDVDQIRSRIWHAGNIFKRSGSGETSSAAHFKYNNLVIKCYIVLLTYLDVSLPFSNSLFLFLNLFLSCQIEGLICVHDTIKILIDLFLPLTIKFYEYLYV